MDKRKAQGKLMGKIADRIFRMMQDGASSASILAEIKRMEDGGDIPIAHLHDEFEKFWANYPAKIGKAAARDKFIIARRRATFQQIIDGLTRYVDKRDDRPWCNPATWLHQGRWEDEAVRPVLRNDSLGASFITAALASKEHENAEVGTVDLFGGDVRRLSGR